MSVPEEAAPRTTVVGLRGLVKRYGAVEALRSLDLTVEAGQVYGFLGRNGAGKSTALRIIMGITQPTAGVIELFGQARRGEEPATRRRIGYVAQEQAFYGWMTALGLGRFVAGFYPTWDAGEYRRLLDLLAVPADRRIQTFSGGNHAKLALALALAHRPELLVLDEPTAGMDAVARREFLELVRDQTRQAGRATLFSSHLIDEVELAADTVGIIDGGRMLWEGPVPELRRQVLSLRHAGPPEAAPPLPPPLGQPDSGATILEDRTEGGVRTVLLRDASAAQLEDLAAGARATGWQVVVPSLEDVFVAMVRRPMIY